MADTCIALRTNMVDVYIALSHERADELDIVAIVYLLFLGSSKASPKNRGAYVDNQK
jgi:hypothetical protein